MLAIALGQPPATADLPSRGAARQPLRAGDHRLAADLCPIFSGVTVTTTISTAVATLTPTRPASTLAPTVTPLPTRTATPTQGAPYIVEEQDLVCDPNIKEPLIQVVMLDAARQQVPGVELVVNWDGGENSFFTGLKPELGAGLRRFQHDTRGGVFAATEERRAAGIQPERHRMRKLRRQPLLRHLAAGVHPAIGRV